jgi:hypothetical protein
MVDILWSMCLLQFYFTLISPSVFGVALYTSLKSLNNYGPTENSFSWTEDKFIEFGSGVHINGAGMMVCIFLLLYTAWVLYSYWAPVLSQYIL